MTSEELAAEWLNQKGSTMWGTFAPLYETERRLEAARWFLKEKSDYERFIDTFGDSQ